MSGIFDGLYVDQLFQKNERGETIYYPFGLMGRGYLLPAEREAGVKSATRRLLLFSIVIGISFALLLSRIVDSEGLLIGGAAFAAVLGGIIYFQSRLANGLEPAPGPRPSVAEWLKRGRQSRAPWTYWVCIVLGLLCLLLAASGFAAGDVSGIVAGAFLLLIGGLLTWDGVMGVRERKGQ